MRKIALLFTVIPVLVFAQDLEVKKLSGNVYQHTSWAEIGSWGRVGSNGLIVIDNGKALLVDTPMDEAQTKELLQYIADSLGAAVEVFVPGHWHEDCVGGMKYLQSIGVKTYANQLTNDILKKQGSTPAAYGFKDSLTLQIGGTKIECYYLGGGHATDNIVVWVPAEKILFGGCMVKDSSATTLGNTADAAPLEQWSKTIKTLQHKFRDARIVVPGHGAAAGTELLRHTHTLLQQ